ncbi:MULTISPECIES: DUF4280 domain-containing protein [Chryseobacterium]|jgi:hypothetical protein|uniref:DUF4280 domain-containing protein n=1 Tax=Chryseobacterium geocarposphaerae TaxID=1416776 RepID=A0ABU1LBH4_9FLAO|nr:MULTISPECIES: DUF4280 domain-containing protein [Chryseobacterium]MDR6404082.1 hypothetical protein [Chryseobacterium geocarposphaerae]MDR6698399.1 hypothetical protein [Chryseobacterium ginsenosidimutans]
MPQKITDSAQLSCNQGTTSSNLKVTYQNFATADGKLIATEEDKQANVNIKPFGQCKLKGSLPCNPIPGNWQKTANIDTINNKKILTEKSYNMCSNGGKINIVFKGHCEEHSM